jgi:cbb3-type cytochrome oxidase cytochrome c subunit
MKMPSRFDKYRFTKRTPLSDEVFNAVFKDIDLRLTALEDVKKEWQAAVNEVTRYGLLRIEEVLRPSFEFIEQKKTEAAEATAEIQALRQNADALINERRDDAISAISTVKANALSNIEQKQQEAVSQIDSALLMSRVMAFFFGGE